MVKIFPYRKHQASFYPTVPMELKHLNRVVFTDALIDSGSNLSIFKTEFAEALGIPLERGQKTSIKGIASEITCYLHKITARVLDKEFECEIAFTRELKFPLNLLGRRGFFDNHEITFNEKEKRVTVSEL